MSLLNTAIVSYIVIDRETETFLSNENKLPNECVEPRALLVRTSQASMSIPKQP